MFNQNNRGPTRPPILASSLGHRHLGRDELRLDLTKDELDKRGESYYVDEKEV